MLSNATTYPQLMPGHRKQEEKQGEHWSSRTRPSIDPTVLNLHSTRSGGAFLVHILIFMHSGITHQCSFSQMPSCPWLAFHISRRDIPFSQASEGPWDAPLAIYSDSYRVDGVMLRTYLKDAMARRPLLTASQFNISFLERYNARRKATGPRQSSRICYLDAVVFVVSQRPLRSPTNMHRSIAIDQ